MKQLVVAPDAFAVAQASLWGSADGTGASLVYYFGLPEGWTPDHVPNKAALGLLRRLVHNKCAELNALSRINMLLYVIAACHALARVPLEPMR